MLLMTVIALVILSERTNCGYIYPRPNIPLKLPAIKSSFQEDIQQRPINQVIPQPKAENVFYSAPFKNYQYHELHQRNSNLLSDNIHASKLIGGLNMHTAGNQQNNLDIIPVPQYTIPAISIPPLELIAPLKSQENNLAVTTGQPKNIPVANIPVTLHNDFIGSTYSHFNIPTIPAGNVPQPINEGSNLEVNTVQHIDIDANNHASANLLDLTKFRTNLEFNDVQHVEIPHINVPIANAPALAEVQRDSEFTAQQHFIPQDGHSDFNSQINLQEGVSPKIVKHIYFHVPPPEFEEPPARIEAPKIKKLKIILIKVPSQERKDISHLQRTAMNQVGPIEEKTIIYVLSKKPEIEQVNLPKPIPSPHEVFFVKYNSSLDTAVTQISDNLEQIDS